MNVVLGGRNFKQKGWVNLDYPFKGQERKQKIPIDVVHNLMSPKPLPFADNSIGGVYTEHCIEHLPLDAVVRVFKEVKRILKQGYPFRISCPDADTLCAKYYKKGEHIWFSRKRASKSSKIIELVDALASPVVNKAREEDLVKLFNYDRHKALAWLTEQVGEVTIQTQAKYSYRHLSWWNWDRLFCILNDAGFRKIRKQKPHESKVSFMAQPFFDNTRPEFSIIVECTK